MYHSFSKLELLLKSKGYIPVNIFTIDDYIVYMEIFCAHNTDHFLLYIPSKYNIKPDNGNIYKLNYVDTESSDNIVNKYAEEPDATEIQSAYNEIDLNSNENQDNIEESLIENYNREILLKDINTKDKDILKNIFRQLTRFKFCVQNIKYKLGIVYKNYLCAIKRDDSMECYYIKKFPTRNGKKLYVSIDLKEFYDKILTVPDDIKTVKLSIYKILSQNLLKHSRLLNDMLNNKDTLLSYAEMILKKKEYFDSYISELENMLNKINDNEKTLIDEIHVSDKKTTEYGADGLQKDIQKSHNMYRINTKLQQLKELKQELVNDVTKTRLNQEHINLEIDKILFDNSVMLNEMIKNFNSITQIIE